MRRADDDRDKEWWISRLLLSGVVASAAVVLLGGAVFLVRHGAEAPELGAFHGEPAKLRTLRGVLQAARAFEARAWIQLGLGILVATPIARVAFAFVAFFRQRDLLYACISGVVLAVLLVSLLSAGSP